MRPLFVLILSISILLGMNWFLGLNPNVAADHSHQVAKVIEAPGEFSIDVTLSFDAGPDQFALDVQEDAPSLLVQMNGNELLKRTGNLSASESPIELRSIDGINVGNNDFYVQASPSDMTLRSSSVRIRVLRDGAVIADKTIWSEPGEIVQGSLRLEVPEQ